MSVESSVAGGRTPAGCDVGLSVIATLVVTLHPTAESGLEPNGLSYSGCLG